MAFMKKLDPLGVTIEEDLGTCFIMSGTSVIGHRVAKGLLEAGHKEVRVGIWKGERQVNVDNSIGQTVAEELEGLGATVIAFDWTDADEYKMALAGVKSVFCTLPRMKETAATFDKFVSACRKYNVEHFVKMSFYEVNQSDDYNKTVPYVQFHRGCDEHLCHPAMPSRMTYTLLRTSHLMSTPLIQQGAAMREEEGAKYVTASYAMGVNYVSPNSVARAAVNVLVSKKKHKNKTYQLTAERPIRDAEVCKLLSKFYDKPIEHVALGKHELEDELKERGFPAWVIKDLANIEQVKASGVEEYASAYSDDIETLTGKKSEGFKDYLADTASMTLQENPPPEV